MQPLKGLTVVTLEHAIAASISKTPWRSTTSHGHVTPSQSKWPA
jgi:hypothetical protein